MAEKLGVGFREREKVSLNARNEGARRKWRRRGKS